eukprot:2727065-Pyramimonas_sp.AAC.1
MGTIFGGACRWDLPSRFRADSAPLLQSQAGIHWISRPPEGQLSGFVFTDGSASNPTDPTLARAGWGIVQVDEAGNFLAGCY